MCAPKLSQLFRSLARRSFWSQNMDGVVNRLAMVNRTTARRCTASSPAAHRHRSECRHVPREKRFERRRPCRCRVTTTVNRPAVKSSSVTLSAVESARTADAAAGRCLIARGAERQLADHQWIAELQPITASVSRKQPAKNMAQQAAPRLKIGRYRNRNTMLLHNNNFWLIAAAARSLQAMQRA